MTTEQLEPFRQMARSIRFAPHIPNPTAYQKLTEPARFLPPSSIVAQPIAKSIPPPEPPIGLSDRIENLIRAAVSRPTVLPPVYVVQENIGDQISRLRDEEPSNLQSEARLPKVPVSVLVAEPPVPAQPKPVFPIAPEPEVVGTEATKAKAAKTTAVVTVEEEEPIAPEALTPEPVSDLTPEPVSEWLETMASYMEQITQELEGQEPEVLVEPQISHPQTPATASGSPAQTVTCPRCNSDQIRKNGRRSGKQKYACKTCGHQFTAATASGSKPSPSKPKSRSAASAKSKPKTPEAFVVSSKPTKKMNKKASTAAKKQGRGFGTKVKD